MRLSGRIVVGAHDDGLAGERRPVGLAGPVGAMGVGRRSQTQFAEDFDTLLSFGEPNGLRVNKLRQPVKR